MTLESPEAWRRGNNGSRLGIGFVATSLDPCTYRLHSGVNITIVTLYIDDILIVGKNHKLLNRVKR